MGKITAAKIKTPPFCYVCTLVLLLLSCLDPSEAKWYAGRKQAFANVVTVDPSGHGNFSKIQSAIDHVPQNNNLWFLIKIKSGTYREKVKIPYEKPYIVLIGAGKRRTEVVWDDHDSLAQSPTFTTMADNTIVKSMSFTNSYNMPTRGKNKNPRVPAVAGMIAGDKSAFFDVGFRGLQDTLWDCEGRHYFHKCTVQGAVDFIFGSGQSIYERCAIQVLGNAIEPGLAGFITAQGRTNPYDANGFVFRNCLVYGMGKAYLGRPWRGYSRVIFYNSNFTKVVLPAGWNAWNLVGHENQFTYEEYGCYGNGSDMSGRVKWVKKLKRGVVEKLAGLSFINRDGWIQNLPTYLKTV